MGWCLASVLRGSFARFLKGELRKRRRAGMLGLGIDGERAPILGGSVNL